MPPSRAYWRRAGRGRMDGADPPGLWVVDVRFPTVMVRAGWHCGGVKENETTAPGGVAVLDDERRYQASVSKDPRFDGVFFIGVTSTDIYCRPSCPAITPKRANMRFYRSAAAAQEAGFRACKRCRPDASPGSPEWNIRADVVGRAMRLIADGVVDRDGVEGLARRLGYEQRQVRRLVTAELGAGPLAIARAQRAQTARILTETTALPLSEIAFAAGFASIRQFNATIREVFAVTPTQLRAARGKRAGPPRRLPVLPGGPSGTRAAGPGEPRAAVARARGRQRAGAAGRTRPAGVGGRGQAARGAADRRLRQAAVAPGRAADALLPGRRDAGRRRPRHA